MSGDTVSEFEFLTLRDLRNCIHVLLQKTPEADWHELSPLLAWAYAGSFDLLGSGPFRIPKKHPNGKNSPPDWPIYSERQRVAIEVSRVTTPQTERAARVGRSVFDKPGLLTNKPPGPDFDDMLRQEHSDDFCDDALEAEQTFDEQIICRLNAKVAGLQGYAEHFDCSILLLYDRLWSGAQLDARLARITSRCTPVGVRQFDAVFITDGSLGQVTRLPS